MTDEKKIDDMSTEELNTALKSDLDQLDNKVVVEPESKPEPEVEPAPDEVAPQKEEVGQEGEDGEDDGRNPYRKRIDRLLRKQDEKDKILAEKDAEIARLKLENETRSDKQEEEDEPEVKKEDDLSSTIHKVLDERENKNRTEAVKSAETQKELDALIKKIPNATERKDEILELSKQYPTLTFEALDRIIAPEDHVDPVKLNRKNAKRMDTSALSRADLESDKDMSKASPDEQEKYLREQIASGNMII